MLNVDMAHYYQSTKSANQNDINYRGRNPPINTNPTVNRRRINNLKFVICKSCLWCASCINLDKLIIGCPLYHDNKIRCISISSGDDGNDIYHKAQEGNNNDTSATKMLSLL
jgi:hypothetical protein